MNRLAYIISALCLMMVSCSKEVTLEGKPDNIYGGANRDNSYEEYGSLISYTSFTDLARDVPDSSGSIIPPLPLSATKIAVLSINGTLVLFNEGYVDWSVKLGTDVTAAAAMCADPKQNIYVIGTDGFLYSFTSEGKPRWKVKFPGSSTGVMYSDLLAQEDGIVCGSDEGFLVKFTFEGKVRWLNKFNLAVTQSFAADENGNLAVPLTHNEFGATDTLALIDKSGNIKWQKTLVSMRAFRTPAISKDRIILPVIVEAGDKRYSKILAFDFKGNVKLDIEMPYTARFVSSSENGRFYVAGYNSGTGQPISGIYCFDNTGKIIWKQYFDVTIPSPLMIGEENLAFVGSKQESLGVYYLDMNGSLLRTVSLSQAPVLHLQPIVKPGAAIVFSLSERMGVLRIDENIFDKILPF